MKNDTLQELRDIGDPKIPERQEILHFGVCYNTLKN